MDPSASGDVASYNIHQGTASGVYTTVVNAGNVTQYVESGLTVGQQLYFVVTAVSATGVESVLLARGKCHRSVADESSLGLVIRTS